MSQEPEKEIEKQLREHADQRRAEAGDQLELHPATRRMLQGEVARTYGTTPPVTAQSTTRPWWSYWPGFLFASCCVLLLAVVLMKPGQNAEFTLTQANNPGPALSTSSELAATSPQPAANAFGAAPAAPPPAESIMTERLEQTAVMDKAASIKEREEMQARSQPVNQTISPAAKPSPPPLAKDLKANEALAQTSAPPAPPRPRPVAVTAPSLASRTAAPQDAALPLPEAKMKRMAVAEVAPDAPVATAPVTPPTPGTPVAQAKLATATGNTQPMETGAVAFAATVSGPASTTVGQRFEQTPSRAGLRRNYQSPAVPEVMERFQVQQNGEEVKIIDSDGSIYVGNMNVPEADQDATLRDAFKKQDAAPAAAVADESRSRAVGAAAMRSGVAAPNTGETATRSFRATGLNRTLNQQVVIDGSFQEPPQPHSVTNAARALKAEAEKAKEALPPIALPRVQIQGRVQVGDRQELIINAVPVNR